MSDYPVGKGKPPVQTRFQVGNQEYRKRGKSKAKNPEGEIFARVMSKTVPVRKGGNIIYKSRMQVMVDGLFANALKGDIKAMESLLTLYRDTKQRRSLKPIFLHLDEIDLMA